MRHQTLRIVLALLFLSGCFEHGRSYETSFVNAVPDSVPPVPETVVACFCVGDKHAYDCPECDEVDVQFPDQCALHTPTCMAVSQDGTAACRPVLYQSE